MTIETAAAQFHLESAAGGTRLMARPRGGRAARARALAHASECMAHFHAPAANRQHTTTHDLEELPT